MAERAVARVLVVDDTEGNRYVTSRLLRAAGYEVIEAADGATALRMVREEAIDLAVLDINLPDITGYEVVQRIREIPDLATLPVLHLSASYVSNTDRALGLERGADAYLTHPIDTVVFVATVRSLLRAGASDRRLQEAAKEWQATFDALSDAVFLLDEHGIVRRANHMAAALLGPVETDGRPLADVLDAPALARALGAGEQLEKAVLVRGDQSYHLTTRRVHAGSDETRWVCVLEDVTERLTAERERTVLLTTAQGAKRDAEEANRAKSEFLAVMSHELRTPLNAIGGYAQLIELGIRGPVTEAQLADIGRIKRSQMYLMSLINDVLNFAKIESGHLQVEMVDFAIGPFVNGMEVFVEPQLLERGLSFTSEPCDDDVFVHADRDKVQQILINLLSNALKFTPGGGSIAIRCTAGEQEVGITVSDTGPGIAPDKLEWIFEPFVQVDRRYKREQEGIGLGLAISRELARAMGGELVASSVEGEGSRFELKLRRTGRQEDRTTELNGRRTARTFSAHGVLLRERTSGGPHVQVLVCHQLRPGIHPSGRCRGKQLIRRSRVAARRADSRADGRLAGDRREWLPSRTLQLRGCHSQPPDLAA